MCNFIDFFRWWCFTKCKRCELIFCLKHCQLPSRYFCLIMFPYLVNHEEFCLLYEYHCSMLYQHISSEPFDWIIKFFQKTFRWITDAVTSLQILGMQLMFPSKIKGKCIFTLYLKAGALNVIHKKIHMVDSPICSSW